MASRVPGTEKSELFPRVVPLLFFFLIHSPTKTKPLGKKSGAENDDRIEVAVKQILSGISIKTNASVANPEALEWFQDWASTGTKRRHSQAVK